MKEQSFEIEKQLIEEYDKTIKSIREFELVKNFYPDSYTEKEEEIFIPGQETVQRIKNKLTDLELKPVTNTKIEILIYQLEAIMNALKENPYGLKISRSQGLIFETAIYGIIINDINWAFQSQYNTWTNPYNCYEGDSNFDHSELKQLLIEFRQSLISQRPDNYIELEARVTKYIDAISELTLQDYQQNILTR